MANGEGITRQRPPSSRSGKADTDSGMTRPQRAAVLAAERKIYSRDTEKGYIIDKNGKVIGESEWGDNANAHFEPSKFKALPKDAVLTHNHPGASLQQGGTVANIGLPFSSADVNLAAGYNLSEIRAVTRGGYVYSLRRNGKTWPSQAAKEYYGEYQKIRDANYWSYETKGTNAADKNRRTERSALVSYTTALKEFAKKHNLTFTRRRFAASAR